MIGSARQVPGAKPEMITHPIRVLSVIPPMTQLNTPYPSTAYLTGFLRSRGIDAVQEDLALALVLRLFSAEGCARCTKLEALPAKQHSARRSQCLSSRSRRATWLDDRAGHRLPAGARPHPGAAHRGPPVPARGAALRRARRLCRRRQAAIRWPGPSARSACRTAPSTWPACTSTTSPTCCATGSIRASSSCATPNRWPAARRPSIRWPRRWPRRPIWSTTRCAT